MQDKKIIKQLKKVRNQVDELIKQFEKLKSGERGSSGSGNRDGAGDVVNNKKQQNAPAKKPGQFTPLRFSMKVNK